MDARSESQTAELVADQNAPANRLELSLHDGFWCSTRCLESTIRFQKQFIADDSDILLSTNPKCGTTWIKALTFSIIKRGIYPVDQSPLLTTHPQELVLSLGVRRSALENDTPSPRMYASHIPYQSLPSSIRETKCRIIYVCRNPLDQFISFRHFRMQNGYDMLSLEQEFDMFCEGTHLEGPFWNHVLGFWEASGNNGRKVLFLKYEDLKEDTGFYVRKIAEFLDMPFSAGEEEQGLVDQIVKLCSFENLTSLEVNKNDINYVHGFLKNNTFFRKGQVGDWRNYLTPSMAKRYEEILESKLKGSGLKFRYY